VVADELLTGTKPKYAEALVRAIIKKVAKFENVICIFASHFDGVIHNAPRETNGIFKQMCVGAKTDDQGFYTGPTYTVKDGISPVDSAFYVAQKKLEKNHQDIVEDAKMILLAEQNATANAA
jgi:DNA mismatch repair ATPase MutS